MCDGKSCGVLCVEVVDGDYCYYLRNAQGDITGFYSMFLSIFREYSYDAWGNITGVYDEKGRLVTNPNDSAFLNPLRYRGYYYDEESGLYYLKSRYYNPEWGRFISADSVVSGTGESVNGYNVYSYCFNNPITLTDPSGCWPEFLKELYSRFKHTTKTFGRIITAPFKALKIEAGVGIGFGFKTKINLKNISFDPSETLILHSFSQVKYRN